MADRRKSRTTNTAGKVVHAKVAKNKRHQAVIAATNRVKTAKPVDVSKMLRG